MAPMCAAPLFPPDADWTASAFFGFLGGVLRQAAVANKILFAIDDCNDLGE
jgi:hypothetical protein